MGWQRPLTRLCALSARSTTPAPGTSGTYAGGGGGGDIGVVTGGSWLIPGIVTGGVVGVGNVTGPGPLGGAVGGGDDVGQVAKPQGESTGGVAGPFTPVPGPFT